MSGQPPGRDTRGGEDEHFQPGEPKQLEGLYQVNITRLPTGLTDLT